MKWFILLIVLTIRITISFAQAPLPNQTRLDSLLNILDANNRLTGSVSIARKGNIIYQRVLGKGILSEEGYPVIAEKNPVLRIGSITKCFTAVMVMKLVETGRLSLDTKLATYFPRLPNAEKITVQQLLLHSSGLHSYDDEMNTNDFDSWIYKPQTRDQMIQRLSKYKPDFEPGTSKSYNNIGYVLLGYILEDVTNMSYGEAVENLITKPLDLTHTRQQKEIDTLRKDAYSYTKDGGWKRWAAVHSTNTIGAGSIASTSNDIAKFYYAVFSGQLISKASLKLLIDNKFGFDKQEDYGGFYGATGKTDKYFSNVVFIPADSITIALSFNGMDYPFGQTFFKIADCLYGHPVQMPSFNMVPLAKAQREIFCGDYKLKSGLTVRIKDVSDELHFVLDADGYGKLKLVSIGNDWFTHDAKGIIIVFGKDKNGKVSKFTMYQANEVIRVEKVVGR